MANGHGTQQQQNRTEHTTESSNVNVNVTQRIQRADWTSRCAATEREGTEWEQAHIHSHTHMQKSRAATATAAAASRLTDKSRTDLLLAHCFCFLLWDWNSLWEESGRQHRVWQQWQRRRQRRRQHVISRTAAEQQQREFVYPAATCMRRHSYPPYVQNLYVHMANTHTYLHTYTNTHTTYSHKYIALR